MKTIKILALVICASALFTTGCKSHCCHKQAAGCPKAAAACAMPSCKMQCCADAKTDCAHCPKCTPAK